MEQDQEDAEVSSSPAYTRKGRCRIRQVKKDEEGNINWFVLKILTKSSVISKWDGAAILDTKW